MKKTFIIIITNIFTTIGFAQVSNNSYQQIVNQVSHDSIVNCLQQFENLGVKGVGSEALNNTKNWLIDKYTTFGYNDIYIDTFTYSNKQLYNIIVKKTGTQFPDKFLIIDGHYDTASGTGTNDNGSGVSVILETARILNNISTKYSILFINFSAEEVGLIGSNEYVNQVVVPNQYDILLVLNIDQVGGDVDETNNIIVCERDESYPNQNNLISAQYTDTLATLTSLYSTLSTEISYAWGSDYIPFQQQGYTITGFYEKKHSGRTHTPSDFLIYLDTQYVTEITKATVGAALYFSLAQTNTSNNQISEKKDLILYPNPFLQNFYLNTKDLIGSRFVLKNCYGIIVSDFIISSDNHFVNGDKLHSGVYFYEITGKSDKKKIAGKCFKLN